MKKLFYLSVHYFEISWKSMPTFRKRIQFLSFHVQALVALSRGFSFSYELPPGGLIGVGVHPLTVVQAILTFCCSPLISTQIMPSSNETQSNPSSMFDVWLFCNHCSHSCIRSRHFGPRAHQLRCPPCWLPALPMVIACRWPSCSSHRMLTASSDSCRRTVLSGWFCFF